ncbi:MAG: hypothetical protein ACLTBV_13810 [Enterocloster bolteae]
MLAIKSNAWNGIVLLRWLALQQREGNQCCNRKKKLKAYEDTGPDAMEEVQYLKTASEPRMVAVWTPAYQS